LTDDFLVKTARDRAQLWQASFWLM